MNGHSLKTLAFLVATSPLKGLDFREVDKEFNVRVEGYSTFEQGGTRVFPPSAYVRIVMDGEGEVSCYTCPDGFTPAYFEGEDATGKMVFFVPVGTEEAWKEYLRAWQQGEL